MTSAYTDSGRSSLRIDPQLLMARPGFGRPLEISSVPSAWAPTTPDEMTPVDAGIPVARAGAVRE
jgi:hypothetical protein